MAAQSIEKFAASIRVPVERLLRQLQEAGVGERSAADSITDDEKAQLLGFLRRSHGAEATDASPTPRKITLTRQVVSELKQPAVARRAGPGAAPATPANKVTVVTRKRRTYVKREDVEKAGEEAAGVELEAVDASAPPPEAVEEASAPVTAAPEVVQPPPVAEPEPAVAAEPAPSETPARRAPPAPVARTEPATALSLIHI